MANEENGDATERLVALAKQGRTWRLVEKYPKFKQPLPLLDPPMEITAAMIRGLRMVDETVVVHGHSPTKASNRKKQNRGGIK